MKRLSKIGGYNTILYKRRMTFIKRETEKRDGEGIHLITNKLFVCGRKSEHPKDHPLGSQDILFVTCEKCEVEE